MVGEGALIAGPAVILSFVLAPSPVFSRLSYAELASSIPVSGSAYTYTYADLGEIVAGIIGWDLIWEYGVSVAAVPSAGERTQRLPGLAFGVEIQQALATSPEMRGLNLPAVSSVGDHGVTRARHKGERPGQPDHGRREAGGAGLLHRRRVVGVQHAKLHPVRRTARTPSSRAPRFIFFAYIGFEAVSTGSGRPATR